MKKSHYLSLLFLLIAPSLFAQKTEAKPKYYVDKDSTLYWNKSLPVFIKLASSPDEQGVNLTSKEFSQYSNPLFLDTEGPNFIRTRYAVDKDTRKVKLPKTEVLFEVVADGTAPSTIISYKNANNYFHDNKMYYGRGLMVELKSNDQYAGVEGVFINVNGQSFVEYTQAQSISEEGNQTIQYYATDKVGNQEAIKTATFVSDLTPPSITHNINGISDSNTIASSSTIYFTAIDPLSGISKSYYRFDDQPFTVYPGANLNLTHLEDGPHALEYYSEDMVGNRSLNSRFEFYYDKLAPLTASDIIGDRYIFQDKVYFSGRTKMKLTAIDNKAGVKEINYSIDNGAFTVYDQPFYLPNVQGNHTIKFYSVDRLSNKPTGAEEYKHNINLVFLDLTGPDLNHSFTGPTFKSPDEFFIGPYSLFNASAYDAQAGLQYISYSLDDTQAETRYDKPFTLKVPSGIHKVELFGYDNVNNRNINQFKIHVDNDPPQIISNFSTNATEQRDNLGVYPAYTVLFLAATDAIVGNDKIYYQINDATEVLYTSPISAFQSGKRYDVKVRAIDKVGNESKNTISFFTGK